MAAGALSGQPHQRPTQWLLIGRFSEIIGSVCHLVARRPPNEETNYLMSIGPMSTRKITHWFARRSFQNRIFLLILFTSTVVMLAMSWYLTDITEERLHY